MMIPDVMIAKRAPVKVEISISIFNPKICSERCMFLKRVPKEKGEIFTTGFIYFCRLFKNHKKNPKKKLECPEKFLESDGDIAFRCKQCLKHFGKAAKIIAAIRY